MPTGSSVGPPGSSGQVGVSVRERLPDAEAAQVLDLAAQATAQDGVAPLSEHAILHVRNGGDPGARDILLFRDGQVAGYAHLDPGDPAAGEAPAAEMVIRPAVRRRGLGTTLGQALVEQAGTAGVRVWAHGDLPAAAGLAAAAGFHRSRALWQMRMPLAEPLPQPRLSEGVAVRGFRPDQDEDAWLTVNSRAFASHPEQGAWTRDDLDQREHEAWFDPAGFFLAERGGRLVGFHWTKVHERAGHEPVGEVYVVGVDPDEQGSGLGRALTLIGLQYLRERGLSAVMLYVDEANKAAIALYESLGFAHVSTDVMFSGQD